MIKPSRRKQFLLIPFCLGISFLISTGGGYPPNPLWAQEGVKTQETTLISINLKRVSINNVLKVLGEKTGLKFVADPAIQDRRITVNLNRVLPDEAISVIMESNGLGYRRIEGVDVYMVSDLSKIMAHTILTSVPCQFADAVKLQQILNQIVTKGVGVVLADERTNTIIIKESPGVIAYLEKLIQELDQPTPQVYIQAAIAEISLTKGKETGVEWLWKDPRLLSPSDKVGTRFDLRSPALEDEIKYFDNEGNPLGRGLPIGQGLGIGVINLHIDAVLYFLQTDYELNLLSRPYLVTLDNQVATIEVGDQIPYKVLSQYGITSYEFKAATIKLLVRPHINNDSTITIELEPSADFQSGMTPDGVPIIATRRAKTRITVDNGNTIVIGGLMRESETKTVSKVPLLGSIPLLGIPFRSRVYKKEKTELVILITPMIVTKEVVEKVLQPEGELSKKVYQKTKKTDINKDTLKVPQ
ncbi:hypothetical protein ISS37_10335 [candidate division KSB1 bacterium]|nr:hypothetical protein [candidate division KSB1 bacterium]